MIKAIAMHVVQQVGCDENDPLPSGECAGKLSYSQVTRLQIPISEGVTCCIHLAADQTFDPGSDVGLAVHGVVQLFSDRLQWSPPLGGISALANVDGLQPNPLDPLPGVGTHTVVHYHESLIATSSGCSDPDHHDECESFPAEVSCTGPVSGLFACKHR